MTIKNQEFDLPPDHRIDWRHHFVGTHNRGHQLNDPNNWNSLLLPELQDLEEKINMSKFRLIKARGLARLSVWFAFGYTFSEMVRYTIEIDQQEKLWRTSAKPNPDFILNSTNNQSPHLGEPLGFVSSSVAVGISITGPIEDDVRTYIAESNEKVSALLFLRPNHELGRDCFQSAGDVVAFADQAKIHMRNFCKYWKAKKLLLFYYGPLSGACFLGHKLNAVCSEIQIMENQQPGYATSFLFTLER
nr:SAVED domain-containing protein [Herpetosiphon giganteus]